MAGPHEILGMSRVLGIGTTEFLALYADNRGTTLRAAEDGRCVFLAPSGCRVHPRRPLVCRLYPLGRTTDGRGEERFAVFPAHSGCETVAGRDGTVGSFMESQGVGPYLVWARRYGELYKRMIGLLDRLDAEGELDAPSADAPAEAAKAGSGSAGSGQEPARAPLSSWQDIDASLAEYCAAKGIAVPTEIDKAITLHLRAMEEWLDDFKSRLGPV
ncbi:MAG: YkgJ family cysteine cluster protein [Candidatus Aminicenantes bacterium]|nr:YkgJ family cysteine cluster protein [Candidatus Aminicenantes bacterium]